MTGNGKDASDQDVDLGDGVWKFLLWPHHNVDIGTVILAIVHWG